MRDSLVALAQNSGVRLRVILTGQALIRRYGDLETDISAAGLHIAHRVPVNLSGADGREMALACAEELRGLAEYWSSNRPDLALILGDRGEMLAAALAAFHLEIPVGHLHGGERSGTLDEGFRHAISKLATYHFVATDDARTRLIRMGEQPASIWVVGAPGLVEIVRMASPEPRWLRDRFGFHQGGRCAVLLFHPVVHERNEAYRQTRELLDAVIQCDLRVLILRPNSDAGGAEIDRCLDEIGPSRKIALCHHLARPDYLAAVASADLLIGNSSSGIIESASLGTACVNVGSRQNKRLRNTNVIDCPHLQATPIMEAIASALLLQPPFHNLYGDGQTDRRLLEILRSLQIGRAFAKVNSY